MHAAAQHNQVITRGIYLPNKKIPSFYVRVSESYHLSQAFAAPLLSSRKVSLLPKTSQESTVIPNSPANYYYIFRIMHNTDHYLHLLIFKTPHTISLDIVNSRTTGTLIISKISPPFNCASILYYYLVCP